jgi:hypothetical protein
MYINEAVSEELSHFIGLNSKQHVGERLHSHYYLNENNRLFGSIAFDDLIDYYI